MSEAAHNSWPEWDRVRRPALIAGGVGAALCGLAAVLDFGQFVRSYLVAYIFWLSIPLGCLPILMLFHLTGGRWGRVIRRVLEAGTRTLPLFALLFLPLAFGMHNLYIWVDNAARSDEELRRHWASPNKVSPVELHHFRELMEIKNRYLNVPFFLIRTAIYFAVWIGLALLLDMWSRQQDTTEGRRPAVRAQALSGPGLVLYALTATFAAVDWLMSLDPRWYSTIFGALVAVEQILPGFAFAIAVAVVLASHKPLSDVTDELVWNDLGNLLLAFVMMWAYMGFSQFLLIWSGNLQEEIPWYLSRMRGGWEWIGLLLIVFYFALPFVLLLSRGIKRRPSRLLAVAAAILVMSVINQFWMIAPSFSPERFSVHWMGLAALIGVGGLWLPLFVWQLKSRPLLPVHDPMLEEVMHHA
jgi:hypothetical protein